MIAFFQKVWGKFQFGKNFMERDSPTLMHRNNFRTRRKMHWPDDPKSEHPVSRTYDLLKDN